MTINSGPNVVKDGLVLHLDAANDKSFRGEPTTNIVTNTNLDTGWSKGYQTDIVFNEIEPPRGVNSEVVGFNRGNVAGYWYSYGDYAPQVPGETYTVSLYVKTLDSNFRITFYTANNSETGRVWGDLISVPNDGKWHRITWDSFVNPSNSQSDSLSFNFQFGEEIGDPKSRTWLCAPQMEAKSYSTPFIVGTRGTTVETGGGWKDLVGSNNLTYYGNVTSNGQYLTFPQNTTTSYFMMNNFQCPTTTVTFMCAFRSTYFVSAQTPFTYSVSGNNEMLFFLTNATTVTPHPKSSGVGFTTENMTNRWIIFHWVSNRVTGDEEYYINNDLLATRNYAAGSLITPGGHLIIGQEADAAGGGFDPSQNLDGDFAIMSVYDKCLTENEVRQNFNALRGRYGI